MAGSKTDQRIEGDNNFQAGRDLNVHYPPPKTPPPASLARVIKKLVAMLDPPPNQRPLVAFEVQAKIETNNVVSYRPHLEEYSTYSKVVDGAYEALALAAYPRGRLVLQRYLRSLYLNLRGQHSNASSDDILNHLINDLKQLAGEVQDVPPDEIGYCCDMLVAHAFVECTVLEPPNAG